VESTKVITVFANILAPLGFSLEAEQPHMSGERFLMMKGKAVLTAIDKTGHKVVVKISNQKNGEVEIDTEKQIHDLLQSLSFSNDSILLPKELYYGRNAGYLIRVTEFINQEGVYVDQPIEKQFFLILRALEAQESFHATTFEHLKKVDSLLPVLSAKDYFREFEGFICNIRKTNNEDLTGTLLRALDELTSNKPTIDAFCNYLTHTDLVPHNFRIRNGGIYILDLVAIRFGNKYESWARFMNYMIIHNPELEQLLDKHVRDNRGEKEYLSLRLMRIFKIGFLLEYYTLSLAKTEGELHILTLERINFWHEILKYIMENRDIPENFVAEYRRKRDALRSDEEKRRQQEFAKA
jgi:hypothetical protein